MALHDLQFPKHYIVGETYVKELWLEHKGDKVRSHSHEFSHLSLLAKGKVSVTVDGKRTEYSGRTGLCIEAGKVHEIEALEPDTLWYCVHKVPEGLRGETLLDDAVSAHN